MKYSLRSLMVVAILAPLLLAHWYFQATSGGGYWAMKDSADGLPLIAAIGAAILIRYVISRTSP